MLLFFIIAIKNFGYLFFLICSLLTIEVFNTINQTV